MNSAERSVASSRVLQLREHQPAQREPQQPLLPLCQRAGCLQVRAMRGDRRPDLVRAAVFARDRLDDRRPPGAGGNCCTVRSRSSRVACVPSRSALLMTNTSAISSRPAFTACTSSPAPGIQHDDRRGRRFDDLEFRLPDADGLDQHPRPAGRIERADRKRGGEREAAGAVVGRHRTHEDALVRRGVFHAQAVAEHRAARERGHRIEREHGDAFVATHRRLEQRADERRLAGAGWAGDADRGGPTRVRRQHRVDRGGLERPPVDQRDRAGERGTVAAQQSPEQIRRHRQLREPCAAAAPGLRRWRSGAGWCRTRCPGTCSPRAARGRLP